MATVMGRTVAIAPAAGGGQDDHDGLGAIGHRGQGVKRQARQPGQGADLALLRSCDRFGRGHRSV